MRTANLALMVVGAAGIVIGVGTAVWAIGDAPPPRARSASSTEDVPVGKPGRFTVSDSRYRFEYELDRHETSVDGILTMTGAQDGVSEGGAILTLHYLSSSAVETFKRTHANPDKCPAPFFNRHAERRILIPATPAIERQLRRIDFPNYQHTADWRRFTVRGHCIRSAPVVSRDGEPGRLPRNMFDACLTMVATAITIGSDPVMPGRSESNRL